MKQPRNLFDNYSVKTFIFIFHNKQLCRLALILPCAMVLLTFVLKTARYEVKEIFGGT